MLMIKNEECTLHVYPRADDMLVYMDLVFHLSAFKIVKQLNSFSKTFERKKMPDYLLKEERRKSISLNSFFSFLSAEK